MNTVVLACNTIREEFEKAATEMGCTHPFTWVESGLHLKPQSLRNRLQEELDCLDHAERVLLGFGFCGNAVAGLISRDYELIIPRADDCISLLLGSKENRRRCCSSGGVYFLTKGWLEGEFNICTEYQAVLARFGPKNTELIYRRMLAHYQFLGLIDTGAYELDVMLPLVNEIAATLNLKTCVLLGSDQYLKKLLSGPWNEEDFVIIPRHTRIELLHLGVGLSSHISQLQGAF
jgi:Protein of unknown function (DUF1638)